MRAEPENQPLRPLNRMRDEHAAAMAAVTKQLDGVKLLPASLEQFHDKLDRLSTDTNDVRGELAAFRAETGKALRHIQSDVISLEGQNISRHGGVLNILRRLDDVEARQAEALG